MHSNIIELVTQKNENSSVVITITYPVMQSPLHMETSAHVHKLVYIPEVVAGDHHGDIVTEYRDLT